MCNGLDGLRAALLVGRTDGTQRPNPTLLPFGENVNGYLYYFRRADPSRAGWPAVVWLHGLPTAGLCAPHNNRGRHGVQDLPSVDQSESIDYNLSWVHCLSSHRKLTSSFVAPGCGLRALGCPPPVARCLDVSVLALAWS